MTLSVKKLFTDDGSYSVRRWCAANGSGDDAANFLAGVTEANGKQIIVPSGAILNLASNVNIVDLPVNLVVQPGGKIVNNGTSYINVTQNPVSVGNVSAITLVFSPTTGYGMTQVSQVVLSAAPAVAVARGDVVMVASDDLARPFGGDPIQVKCQEMVRVMSVAGTTVVLADRLRHTYTTNVRMYRISDNQVAFKDVNIIMPDWLTMNTTGVTIQGAKSPKISGDLAGISYQGVALVTCWQPEVRLKLDNGRDTYVDSSIGYGLNVGGATRHGDFVVRGNGLRHMITATEQGGGSQIGQGQQVDCHVHDSIGYDCVNATYDNHSGAENWKYSNCWAYKRVGNFDYPTENFLFSFNFRSAGVELLNCGAVGVGGIAFAGATSTRNSLPTEGKWTSRVVNFHSRPDASQTNNAGNIYLYAAYDAATQALHEVIIDGGLFSKTGVTVENLGPKLRMRNVHFPNQDTNIGWSLGAGNTAFFESITRESSDGTLRAFMVGAGSSLHVGEYKYLATTHPSGALIAPTGTYGSATSTVRIDKSISLNSTFVLTNVDQLTLNTAATPVPCLDVLRGGTESYVHVGNVGGTIADYDASWFSKAACIAFTMTGSLTMGSLAPSNLPKGGRFGIMARQDATGTRALTFGGAYKVNAGNTASGAANTISYIEFIYDGGNFIQVSGPMVWM